MNSFEEELYYLNTGHKCTFFDDRANIYCGKPATKFYYEINKKDHNLRCFCEHDALFHIKGIPEFKELSETEFDAMNIMEA